MAFNPSEIGSPPRVRQVAMNKDFASLCGQYPQRYPFLLQSVTQGTPQARYDILFAFPGEQLRLGSAHAVPDFLPALDQAWARTRYQAGAAVDLPFTGGWFLYLGYELAAHIEPRLENIPRDEDLPVALATRIPAAIIRDHARNETWLVAEQESAHLLDALARDLEHARPPEDAHLPECLSLAEDAPQEYLRAVQRIKDYIVAGDVFQVNLSRAWGCEFQQAIAPIALYGALCRENPAPFAALVILGESAIISSSPERLVKVRNGVVEVRPIAGTCPRGANALSDATLLEELSAHPKERAEHIMLVDLERNDLGRVCTPGSIRVDEFMTLESYTHVHHIVSNVRGELRKEVTPGEIIRAVFPGGTITGCPKIRCMEIIAELERVPRGPYTGSVGYLNRDGSLDLNILIRTLVHKGRHVSLRAGAGIVADSQPQRELEETRSKARGLLRALGVKA